jgi:hypothetical protein
MKKSLFYPHKSLQDFAKSLPPPGSLEYDKKLMEWGGTPGAIVERTGIYCKREPDQGGLTQEH